MAEALLITNKDIIKFTALNGNIDVDKFMQFIKIAQDVHIQRILGTRLLNRIKSDIENDAYNGLVLGDNDYYDLLIIYIKPMLIHWSMVEYLPFSAYTIANKGVFKHSSENSVNVEKNEVDFITEKQRSIAENYTQRFVDYICFNSTTFPEYNENTNGDVHPDSDINYGGWYL